MNRPLIIPAVITALAFCLLAGLGIWQVERLQWKEALLAEIHNGLAMAPTPLPDEITDPAAWSYRKVELTGRFDHRNELYLNAIGPGGSPGYHVLTPLLRADAMPVLVDRGWIPLRAKSPMVRAEGQPQGVVTVRGISRAPLGPGPFTPSPDEDADLWFAVDLTAMSRSVGLPLAPIIVEADGTENPGGLPLGGQTRVDIPNNHLSYAITWFSLSVAVVVIFVVYARRRR